MAREFRVTAGQGPECWRHSGWVPWYRGSTVLPALLVLRPPSLPRERLTLSHTFSALKPQDDLSDVLLRGDHSVSTMEGRMKAARNRVL